MVSTTEASTEQFLGSFVQSTYCPCCETAWSPARVAVAHHGVDVVMVGAALSVLLFSRLPPLPPQGVVLPEDLSWKEVEKWVREGGAGGEVLLVFENAENVLLRNDKCVQVRGCCAVLRCAVLFCPLLSYVVL